MKNLAVVETAKLDKVLDNQSRLVEEFEAAAVDFQHFHPFTFPASGDEPPVWILFGSERGFSGDFNEALVNYIDENPPAGEAKIMLIPVGSRLCTRLQDDQRVVHFVEGADVAEEITPVLNVLLGHINALQEAHDTINVHVLFHRADTGELASRRLIPPSFGAPDDHPQHAVPPILNVAPEDLLAGMVDYYLFITLVEIAGMSLLAENYRRIQHMTGAIQRIDETVDGVTRKYHMVRQEEIKEEIEVILLNAMGA